MDWQTFPNPTVPDAQDYTEPHLTELVALSAVTYPRPDERRTARLRHLIGRRLAAFLRGRRAGWLGEPEFSMPNEVDCA